MIGAGAAGLHLVLAMIDDVYFKDKKILLIDKDRKNENDRTWCYWEKGDGKWDAITYKVWNKGVFRTADQSKQLEIAPYRYKMIKGIDFYNYCKEIIQKSKNIEWAFEEVVDLKLDKVAEVNTNSEKYIASHVFDSRIGEEFSENCNHKIKVLQHFKGWVIETKANVFDDSEFTMMDFRVQYKNQTGFIYILPFSQKTALIEFTLFTPWLIEGKEYDEVIRDFVDSQLKIKNYDVVDEEHGIIPMTNFPFHKKNSALLTKIGTAGSWVKPSSGYSFKNAHRYSLKLISNIKKGKIPSTDLIGGRFRKYDTLFLEILQNKNELGPQIFEDMYVKNKASQIFKFLDEETSLSEDFKIISSFKPAPFRQALSKHWKEWLPTK